MTIKDIENGYSVCGLVCALCNSRASCAGCQDTDGDCGIKACCFEKGLTHCYLCDEFPCGKDEHIGLRKKAFNAVARAEGLPKLAEYLFANQNRGIFYHRPGGFTGDYDGCKSEEEIIYLLKHGRPDPCIK